MVAGVGKHTALAVPCPDPREALVSALVSFRCVSQSILDVLVHSRCDELSRGGNQHFVIVLLYAEVFITCLSNYNSLLVTEEPEGHGH